MTTLTVRDLGLTEYTECWQAMKALTDSRDATTEDEIWLVEHPPVYTQGQAGKAEHVLNPGNIPIVPVDRGGQVTYHGPGQLVAYLMLDLKRLGIGVRQLVSLIEQSIVDVLLNDYGVEAYADPDAPGVYYQSKKIAALGLRVRRGCSFHGLSFNIDMDLTPFAGINPCGYQGLEVVQLKDLVADASLQTVKGQLTQALIKALGYESWASVDQPWSAA